jgi:hypothetical protein
VPLFPKAPQLLMKMIHEVAAIAAAAAVDEDVASQTLMA